MLNLTMLGFVLLTAALIAFTCRVHARPRPSGGEPVELKPVPFTQPLGIEPTDPMVLCPRCRCMGHHSLELVPAKPPAPVHSFTDPSGNRVDVFTWQSAAGTAEHYRRECVFCGHTWSVSA